MAAVVDKIVDVVGMAILKVIQKLHEKVGNIAAAVHKAIQGVMIADKVAVADRAAGLVTPKVIHVLHRKVGNIVAVAVCAATVHAVPMVAARGVAQGQALTEAAVAALHP
jgi:hypothetical protein